METSTPDNTGLIWREQKDDERPGLFVHIAERPDGNHYVVESQADGTWSWVLVDAKDGFPKQMRCNLASFDAAKKSLEKNFRGDVDPRR